MPVQQVRTSHFVSAKPMPAVWTERVNSRSKDLRPLGVITASSYYGCGCR
ncbi:MULTISPECIES: hypothetical protein [unclassified Streptomyces]|nr:hypothetical protein [Streptomyces sp. DK15]MDX2391106.1 hypothetical protein [Streptomyces sp. DK15]